MTQESLVTRVAVFGAGQMGAGIAQVAALAGLSVVLIDATPELAERGKRNIAAQLQRQLEKARLSESEVSEALARIRPSTQLVEADTLDLVIEAIPEQLELKR